MSAWGLAFSIKRQHCCQAQQSHFLSTPGIYHCADASLTLAQALLLLCHELWVRENTQIKIKLFLSAFRFY